MNTPPPQFERINAPDYCKSHCGSIFIDMETRKCKCKECGRIIDPFDYLWGWSQKEYFYVSRIEQYELEANRLRTEVETLRKERNNLKAQIKRRSQQADLMLEAAQAAGRTP